MIASLAPASAPPWRRYVPDPSRLLIPPALETRLDAGDPSVVSGRSSVSDGSQGRRLAVDDIFGAVEVAAKHTGIDFTAALPPREALIHKLETAPVHTSLTFEGKPFRNRYAVLDLRERAGLIVLLSNGSGHLLDEEGIQPFVAEAAQLMRKYRASLYACKRFDRIAREDWGAAPVMTALRQLEGFLCDEDGLGKLDRGKSVTWFVKGGGSREQADHLPEQSVNGQKNRSGTELVDGRVAYHIATTPPPGCGVVWLKGSGTVPSDRVMFLDTPHARPPDAQVASGLPQVFDDDGDPIDQVANVRFILAKYGRDDWPAGRLIGELARRGFSTEGMRVSNRDLAATIRTSGAGNSVLGTVIGHLNNYEQQRATIQIGASEEPHVITGFSPPDGEPWARPEDFARIRSFLRDRDQRMEKATLLTFSGLRARLDGQAVRMLVNKKPRGPSQERSYRFVVEGPYPDRVVSAAPRVLLPPLIWARSIVDGLAGVDDHALLPAELFDRDEGPDDGLGRMRGELATIETQIAAGEARLDTLMGRLEEVHPDGSPVLTGAMLARVQTDYNQLAENTLPELRHRRDEVALQIEETEARRPSAADPSGLLLLVDSLRDAEDRRFRPVWLRSIRNLEFTCTRPDTSDMSGYLLTWAGAIEFATPDQASVLIPFSGSYDTRHEHGRPRPDQVGSAVDRCLEAMRQGVPFGEVAVPHRAHLLSAVRTRLGDTDGRNLPLLTCDDPHLVRITTEALLRPDEPASQIADDLDAPACLIERIRDIQAQGGQGWLLDGDLCEVALYVLAAEGHGPVRAGDVARLAGASLGQVYNVASRLRQDTRIWSTQRKRGYILARCECGALARAPMRLRECVGPVCLSCRRDHAGVRWPAAPYDRYRAHPTLWSDTPWQIEAQPDR